MIKTAVVGAATTILAGSITAAFTFWKDAVVAHEKLQDLEEEYKVYVEKAEEKLDEQKRELNVSNAQIASLNARLSALQIIQGSPELRPRGDAQQGPAPAAPPGVQQQ